MCFSWKELHDNSNSRKIETVEYRKKTKSANNNQIQYTDHQSFSDDENNEEIDQQEYNKFCQYIFSNQPNEIGKALDFFQSHPKVINFHIFQQLLNIANNFQINSLDHDNKSKIMAYNLIAIEKSINNDFCNYFFQNGYYECIKKYILEYNDDGACYIIDASLAKYALNVFTRISNTSFEQASTLFQNGMLEDLNQLFPFLLSKSNSPNWANDHRDIYEGTFELILNLLHYPQIFVAQESTNVNLLPDIYKNITNFILNDLNENIKSHEIDLSLSFIRLVFICINFFECQQISPDYLIENFNDQNIFNWVIYLAFSEEIDDEYLRISATETLVAITSSYDTFSIIFINNPLFSNFFDNINSNKLNPQITANVCSILRNLFANNDLSIINFLIVNQNIMNFIKEQMNGIFVVKFEAFYSILNLVLLCQTPVKNSESTIRKIEAYFDANLDILGLLVNSLLIFNEQYFLKAILCGIRCILWIGERKIKKAQKNIYAKVFADEGIFDFFNQIQFQNMDEDEDDDILEIMREISELVNEALMYDKTLINSKSA